MMSQPQPPNNTLPQDAFIVASDMQQHVATVPSPLPSLMGPQSQPVQITLPPSAPQQPLMGPQSTGCICPSCNKHVNSKTSRKAKSSAWFACILLCVLGCFCGCCLLPCCLDSCNVVNHKCPECGSFLGQYST